MKERERRDKWRLSVVFRGSGRREKKKSTKEGKWRMQGEMRDGRTTYIQCKNPKRGRKKMRRKERVRGRERKRKRKREGGGEG